MKRDQLVRSNALRFRNALENHRLTYDASNRYHVSFFISRRCWLTSPLVRETRSECWTTDRSSLAPATWLLKDLSLRFQVSKHILRKVFTQWENTFVYFPVFFFSNFLCSLIYIIYIILASYVFLLLHTHNANKKSILYTYLFDTEQIYLSICLFVWQIKWYFILFLW